jgi:hypothetical protein
MSTTSEQLATNPSAAAATGGVVDGHEVIEGHLGCRSITLAMPGAILISAGAYGDPIATPARSGTRSKRCRHRGIRPLPAG